MKNEDLHRELAFIRAEISQLRGQVGMLSMMMSAPLMQMSEGLQADLINEAVSAIGFSDSGLIDEGE